jgi:hypothetical protein
VYRLPVILCCLEGRSLEEAARQLGWTPASVKGRLARGRARLHDRLVRRGLRLSAALAAVEVSRGLVSAAVLARLLVPTVRGAIAFGARQEAARVVSAQATALAGELVNGMALARLKIAAALMLATCLLTAGLLLYRADQVPRAPFPQARWSPVASEGQAVPVPPAVLVKNPPGAPGDDDPIEVRGRVLGPQGRPFAGARLYVGYTPRRIEPDAIAHQPVYPLRTTSGTDGRFHFTFARSDLDERYLDASRPVVAAVADGLGFDWAEIGALTEGAELSLRLVEDLPLEGRILGPDRRPVAGARVFVRAVGSSTADGLTGFLQNEGRSSGPFKSYTGPLPGQPPQVTTAADGRFRVTGVGRDRLVTMVLDGPAIPRTGFMAVTRTAAAVPAERAHGVPFDHVAPLSRSLRGVVRDKATGKPVAGVTLGLQTTGPTAVTDKDGRYELLGCPMSQGSVVVAQPQSGQLYFATAARLPDASGPDPLTADFELVGGIPLRGRVTDQATGKPPKRGVVEYYPLFPNAHSAALTNCSRMIPASSAPLQPDGSYRLVVLPGPGVVVVAASPRDSYASARLDAKELADLFNDGIDRGGGSWVPVALGDGLQGRRCVDRYNALSLIKPDEEATSLALDLTVQRVRPLRGTVVEPDGKPLAGVKVSGLTSMPDAEMLASASFAVEGLNPRLTRQLFFYHGEKRLGKVLTVHGDETKTLTVQLEPCGEAIGRMVDKAGKPVPGEVFWFGGAAHSLDARAETDSRGCFRAALVPGVKYRLGLSPPRRLLRMVGDVEVGSRQSKDLGDLLLDD